MILTTNPLHITMISIHGDVMCMPPSQLYCLPIYDEVGACLPRQISFVLLGLCV